MDRYILSCALLCAAFVIPGAIVARQHPVDTVLKVDNPSVVRITESPEGLAVKVEGSKADSALVAEYSVEYAPEAQVINRQSQPMAWNPFSGRRGSQWDVMAGSFNFGFVGALGAPQAMDAEWSKSFEIAVPNIIGVAYSPLRNGSCLKVSWGMSWRSYRMTTPVRFIPADGGVDVGPYPADASPRNSRIKVFSWSFPIVWHQRFSVGGYDKYFNAGVILNYNSYASCRTTWVDPDGEKVKDFSKRIGQRRFSADLYASLSIAGGVSVYARWSPMKVLREPSPGFRPLSIGLSLGF